MPRTEEANQLIRDVRKAQILEVSLKIFGRKGLTDTRIADIAAETGMSQGLIYRYFASKEEVFATLVENVFLLTLALVEQAHAQAGTPIEKIEWLTEQLLPYQYYYPEGSLVVIYALINEGVPTDIRETALSYSKKVQTAVKTLIAEGQAAGQVVDGDSEQLMILYLATLQGLAAAAGFLERPPDQFPTVKMILQFLKP